MELKLVISKHCSTCEKVRTNLQILSKEYRNINLIVFDIKEQTEMKVFIVPALFIDSKLYYYGEPDIENIKYLINNKSRRKYEGPNN